MATIDDGWQSITNLGAIDGSVRPVILDWETAATEAAAETLRAAWLVDYLVVGTGVPKSWSNAHHYHDDAYALPSSQDAERGEYAILVTTIDGDATKTAVVNLPFPKSTTGLVYVSSTGPGRNLVNTASTELADYMANFIDTKAFISDGEHSAGNIVRGKRSGT